MKFSGIVVAVRDAVGQPATWLLRALRQRGQREIKQPEHIAWHALKPDYGEADGSMRMEQTGWSLWKQRFLALTYLTKHLSWIAPITMLERLRGGLSMVKYALSAGGRKA